MAAVYFRDSTVLQAFSEILTLGYCDQNCTSYSTIHTSLERPHGNTKTSDK